MEKQKDLVLSALGHTWILDLDGTIVKHNGYKNDGYDTFLEGAEAFLKSIPSEDTVIFLTSRTKESKAMTEDFLKSNHVRYDCIIYGVPYGERIIINDRKPSGLQTAVSVNVERNVFQNFKVLIDETL